MAERDLDRAMSFEGIAVPVAALEEAELFQGLGPAELQTVAAAMRFRSFKAGELVCREGEQGESMFVIVAGLVDLLRSLAEMPDVRSRSIFDEGRLVGKLRAGEVVGTGSLLTGEPRSATAKAAVDSDLLELGQEDFRALIGKFPQLLENLTRILTRRLAEATAGQARARPRGESVALIVGASAEARVPEMIEATSSGSPGAVASLDARGGATDALGQLDGALRSNATAVVIAALDDDELPQLIQQVDRSVAVVGDPGEGARLGTVAATQAIAGQQVEAILVSGLSAAAVAPERGPSDAVRVVRAFAQDGGSLSFVGRHVARTKLGLALGAGGAKGYAHVGALHALEEAGYAIDYVSGSSIGAIIGTWIAFGMDAGEIESAMRETFTPETVAETLKISLSGQASGLDSMVQILREITAGRTFDDTTIPLAIMTADLTKREAAPLREGPLDEALIAATALAGVFPPHELGGHRLVDGLAIDPVPTAAVIEDGADVTVSINLIPRETLEAWPGQEPPEAKERRRRPGMLDTLLEVMDLAQLDTSERGTDMADVPVTPRFGPGSWKDFELADLYLAAGREAMELELPALRARAEPQFAQLTTTG
jgi:predicted acylesterase/phospholipase RssA/CRP-like cAMP-binding protein